MAHDALAVTALSSLLPHTVRTGRARTTRIHDVREVHARVLWEQGWGAQRFPSFGSYLATMPRVPSRPAGGRFSKLVLVDRSMPLTQACRLLGITYGGDDTVFESFGDTPATAPVYWMWVDCGEHTAGQPPLLVREALGRLESALTVIECLALYAANPHAVTAGRCLQAAASRIGSFPAYCGCLMIADGVPELGVAEYCTGSSDRLTPTRWG